MKRVLFDENLPRLLAREFADFEVRTVPEVGWAGIKNGKLLRLAEAEFDVFLTADKNLSYQQPLISCLRIAIDPLPRAHQGGPSSMHDVPSSQVSPASGCCCRILRSRRIDSVMANTASS